MRRGEVLGLRWSDVDLGAKRITIRQAMTMTHEGARIGTPKTASGQWALALDDGTFATLTRWRTAQTAERLLMARAGGEWSTISW
jgi:integrase